MRQSLIARPLWWSACALAVGIALGLGDWSLAGIIVTPAAFAAVSTRFDADKSTRLMDPVTWAVTLVPVTLGVGLGYWSWCALTSPPPVEPGSGSEVVLEALVVGVLHRTEEVDVYLLVNGFRSRVRAGLGTGSPVLPGDRLLIRGRLERPRAARNPYGFDERRYWYGRGVGYLLRDATVLQHVSGSDSPQRRLARWRGSALRHVYARFSESTAPLVTALVFGESGAISPDLQHAFHTTGTVHLLAVSGLHVGIIGAVIMVAVSRTLPSRRLRWLTVLLIIVLYAGLAGARPPVLRAATAAGLSLLGPLSGRPVDRLNVVGAAAIPLLLFNPPALWDLSFQLSFLSVIGMVVLSPRLRRLCTLVLGNRFKLIADGASAGLAAQLALLPVLGHAFGAVSWWGPVATLLLLPLVTLVLFAALGWTLLELVLGHQEVFFYGAVEAAAHLLRWAVGNLSRFTGATIMPALPGWWIALYYSVLLTVMADWRGPVEQRRSPASVGAGTVAKAAVGAATLWVLAIIALRPWGLELVFLDVGQGDAIVVGAPGGRWAVVDAGRNGRQVIEFLQKRGVSRLEWIAATHEHVDHQGGIPRVVSTIRTGALVVSPFHAKLPPVQQGPGLPLLVLDSGDTLPLPPLELEVFSPDSDNRPLSINDRSLVLGVSWQDWRAILVGDLEATGERALLQRHGGGNRLHAHILKVGHHGSATSTSNEFLAAIRPRLAIIQVGRGNRYGHPDPAVLRRLEQAGVTVLRNDIDGAVWLRLKSGVMEIINFSPDGRRHQIILHPEEPVRWRRILPAWMRLRP